MNSSCRTTFSERLPSACPNGGFHRRKASVCILGSESVNRTPVYKSENRPSCGGVSLNESVSDLGSFLRRVPVGRTKDSGLSEIDSTKMHQTIGNTGTNTQHKSVVKRYRKPSATHGFHVIGSPRRLGDKTSHVKENLDGTIGMVRCTSVGPRECGTHVVVSVGPRIG